MVGRPLEPHAPACVLQGPSCYLYFLIVFGSYIKSYFLAFQAAIIELSYYFYLPTPKAGRFNINEIEMKLAKSKFTTEQIEAMRSKLKDLPDPEKINKEHSKAETVRMLSREIGTLQKRGYSLEQISEYLKGGGMDIGTATLKSYLQRVKTAAAPKPKAKEPKDTPPAAPPETSTPRPEVDKSKAYFTPRPDTDDI